MPDGGHAANGKTRLAAHPLGICTHKRFADDSLRTLKIGILGTADQK
jgi:hypothetical protein